MTLQITHRQSNVLTFIRTRIERDGQSPTLEEIGDALGIGSVSAVLKHVRSLEAKGRLTLEPHHARSIRLVREPDPMDADTLELPLVGRIAAGEPLFSESRVDRRLRVSRALFRLRPDYLVKVVGDSMRRRRHPRWRSGGGARHAGSSPRPGGGGARPRQRIHHQAAALEGRGDPLAAEQPGVQPHRRGSDRRLRH
jgi:SOS-response transcriptional repressors (RecA-mediated autopeptidases)